MRTGQTFKDRVLDQLGALGGITGRPMFGGYGIYWNETIFAILFGDRLYFKVDDQSKGDYVSRGMPPFGRDSPPAPLEFIPRQGVVARGSGT
jgi:DNA transformation protein